MLGSQAIDKAEACCQTLPFLGSLFRIAEGLADAACVGLKLVQELKPAARPHQLLLKLPQRLESAR